MYTTELVVFPSPAQPSAVHTWELAANTLLADLHAPTQAWEKFPWLVITQSRKWSVVCEKEFQSFYNQ